MTTPGFTALSSAPKEVKAEIVPRLGEILQFLLSSMKEGGRRRTVLLWALKCWLLTDGKYSCLSCLPTLLLEFSARRDVGGLMEATKIVFKSGNCDPAVVDFQVCALTKAIQLEPHQGKKELIGAGAVEVLSHLPLPTSPETSQLATELTSLQWTDSALLTETIKISWNSWVKAVSSGGTADVRSFWFRLLATLHNSTSRPGDEIVGDTERPTVGNISSL